MSELRLRGPSRIWWEGCSPPYQVVSGWLGVRASLFS